MPRSESRWCGHGSVALVVGLVAWAAGRPARAAGQAGVSAHAAAHETFELGYDDSATYVVQVLRERLGELPRMGWLGTGEAFLATERHAMIALFAPLGVPPALALGSALPDEEARRIRRQGVACEQPDSVPLYSYPLAEGSFYTGFDRALYATHGFAGGASGAFRTRALLPADLETIARLLGWPEDGLRRDEAVITGPGRPFYSIHMRYDVAGTLVEDALLLHAAGGDVIAYEGSPIDPERLCDACAPPTYADGYSFSYRIENVFDLPGFAYPVLLLDTSTVEGRALSLLTFTPAGDVSEYRVYEYVVNCH